MKKRIGICGCTGHVVKFGRLVNSFEESEITVVWDRDVERGRKVAEELKVPFEPDFESILNDYALDGILVIVENSYKAELCIKAAQHGISLFVEKPVCVNLKEAEAVREAVRKNNVRFYMSDPFVRKGVMKIREMIRDGILGTVKEAQIRIAQNRPHFRERFAYELSQGGIMADVGGHAIHICHYLFGMPGKISSVLTYDSDFARENKAETNADVVMLYDDGLMVRMECSFVTKGLDNLVVVRGSEATAAVIREENDEHVELFHDGFKKEIITDMPEPPHQHIRYFIEMLVNDYPNDIVGKDPFSNSGVSIDDAIEYVRIINAIYEGANRGLMEIK